MKLLSDSHFDINKFYGNLVLLYPEGRRSLIESLEEQLELSGYVYYSKPVGPSLLQKGDAFDEIVSLLDRCVCLVPALDRALFEDEENSVIRSMFWYFIGYMRSKPHAAVVPFIPGERPDLKGSPLQGIDIMFDADTFMAELVDKADYNEIIRELKTVNGWDQPFGEEAEQ